MAETSAVLEDVQKHVQTVDEAELTHTLPNGKKTSRPVTFFLSVCLCAVVWLVRHYPLLLLLFVLLCVAQSGGAVKTSTHVNKVHCQSEWE